MRKKILVIAFAFALPLALVGCGKSEDAAPSSTSSVGDTTPSGGTAGKEGGGGPAMAPDLGPPPK